MAQRAWGERVDEVLADGEWHDIDDVIADAVRRVPPGLAYRKGEARRTHSRGDGRTAPERRQLGTREVAVATGARTLVRKSIESRLRRGTAVRWGDRIRKARP